MLVIALALAGAGAGVGYERRHGDAARALSARLLNVLLWVAMPVITFSTVVHLRINGGLGIGLLFAHLTLVIVTALAWLIGSRYLRLPRATTGALMIGVMIANTGSLGLPLAGALLGAHALGAAILYTTIVTEPWIVAVGFAVGAVFGKAPAHGGGGRLRAFIARNPPLWALLAAFVAPPALAPAALVSVAHALIYASAALAFFAVGVNLTHEREDGTIAFPPPITRPVVAILALRLIVAPILLLLASVLVFRVPDAYLLQAAMPCGLMGLLVAHVYGLDLRLTCAAIFWSNATILVAALLADAIGIG